MASTLVFDRWQDAGTIQDILQQIRLTEYGGQRIYSSDCEFPYKTMDKGGIAIEVPPKHRLLTLSHIRPWCVDNKISVNIPLGERKQGIRIYMNGFGRSYDEIDIVELVEVHKVEVMDIFLHKNAQGISTGAANLTIRDEPRSNSTTQKWLQS